MPKQPIRLSDITTPFWKIHIYGAAGVGKSVWCTGSKTMRTFVFDVDEGMNSAKAFHTKNGGKPENVMVWPVVEPNDFYEGINWLRSNLKEVDLIVIDTATELQRIILHEIMTKSKNVKADYDDWGAIKNAMETICITMRRIPKDIIFVGHETNKADKDEPKIWRPIYDGAFSVLYQKHFSEIGRFIAVTKEVKEEAGKSMKTARAMMFTLNPMIHSKDRSTMLDPYEPVDNIDDFFAKIRSSTVNPDPDVADLPNVDTNDLKD